MLIESSKVIRDRIRRKVLNERFIIITGRIDCPSKLDFINQIIHKCYSSNYNWFCDRYLISDNGNWWRFHINSCNDLFFGNAHLESNWYIIISNYFYNCACYYSSCNYDFCCRCSTSFF